MFNVCYDLTRFAKSDLWSFVVISMGHWLRSSRDGSRHSFKIKANTVTITIIIITLYNYSYVIIAALLCVVSALMG